MAAFIKAVNAKIRANPMLSYVCSTRTSSPVLPILKTNVPGIFLCLSTGSRHAGEMREEFECELRV
jgi:hypothetical protein